LNSYFFLQNKSFNLNNCTKNIFNQLFVSSTTIVSDVLSYDVWPCSENAGNMNKSMAGNKNIIEKFFKLVLKRILKIQRINS